MELLVDNFAGGGGASTGIERACCRPVDIAVNHDASAIEMHAVNHPLTRHYREDVWKINPKHVCGSQPVGLAWFSPDCKHFSRAKGGKPVSPRVRGLAMVAVRWAREVAPRVIILENVREFQEWGPLIPKIGVDGKPVLDLHGNPQLVPDPDRKGHSFRRFVGLIRNLGYKVEWRDLDAADFGAPTHRRRLFLIARNDGEVITWPAVTHGPKGSLPYRSAAECIDWSLPGTTIFDPRANGKMLVDNTMRRVAHGFMRFVNNNPKPYIVTCNHAGAGFRGQSVDEPFKTVTASRDAHGIVTPYVIQSAHGGHNYRAQPIEKPLNSVLGSNAHSIASPYLIRYNTENGHGGLNAHPACDPVPTVVSENRFAVVAPYVVRIGQTGSNGIQCSSMDAPLSTIVTKQEHLKVTPYLVRQHGTSIGRDLNEPTPAILGSNHHTLVAPWIVKHFGGQIGADARRPLPTTMTRGTQNQLAAVRLIPLSDRQADWYQKYYPNALKVYAFIVKYYGACDHGQSLHEPLHTATGKARFALVQVIIDGESNVVVDILMRMFTPRELARAQGFDDSFILTGNVSTQTARIGNSVCPIMAEVLVRANFADAERRLRKTA